MKQCVWLGSTSYSVNVNYFLSDCRVTVDKMDNIHTRDMLPGTHPDSGGGGTSKEKAFQEKKLNNAHKHLTCSSFTRKTRSFRVRCSYAGFDCGPFQLWPRLHAVPPHWTKQETAALCESDIINKQPRFCCSWEFGKVNIWRISIRTHELFRAVSYSRISKSDSRHRHYHHVNRLSPHHLRITVQYYLCGPLSFLAVYLFPNISEPACIM